MMQTLALLKRSTGLITTLAILAACTPATPTVEPQTITVQYTAAAQPWLSDLYACAGKNILVAQPRPADYFDPHADLALRVGQPAVLTTPAYRIGMEDVLVVVNRAAPVASLTAAQVEELFSGRVTDWNQVSAGTSGKVQIWVLPSGDDVEEIFEATVLNGTPVTSLARLANSPDEMIRAIASDENAVGVLPVRGKPGDVTSVFTAASVPVLAITPTKPTGASLQILACLGK
jgi:hypothetical protein